MQDVLIILLITILVVVVVAGRIAGKKKGLAVQQPTVPAVVPEHFQKINSYNDLYELVVVRHDWRTFSKVAGRVTGLGYWGEGSRNDGKTPVRDALKNGETEVIDLLIQELDRSPRSFTPLH